MFEKSTVYRLQLTVICSLFVICHLLLATTPVYARTTPEDILNAQKQEYNQRVKNYSAENKQKLELFSQKIAALNASQTNILDSLMERQGQILDEYMIRNKIDPPLETDGIHRRDNPFENTRYWITFAHEAVAYQAAKIYLINLTGEANVNKDILSTISALQSDIGVLKGKVIKSQETLESLLKK